MILEKAKLLNVPSISQTSTLPKPAITQAIKKLTDGNNFILIWKSTGKPTYWLVKRHYVFIIVHSSKWERRYSPVFRSSLAKHNQLPEMLWTIESIKHPLFYTFPKNGGEQKWQRLTEEPFRAERPAWSQKVKNPLLRSGKSSQFHPLNSYFLFFSLSNERSYYWQKG